MELQDFIRKEKRSKKDPDHTKQQVLFEKDLKIPHIDPNSNYY